MAVINEKMARFYFPRTNPLGRHILEGDGKDRIVYNIVGVFREVKESELRQATPRRLYKAYLQHAKSDPIEATNFEIRTRAPSADIREAVRRKISDFNPNLPILSIESADALIDDTLIQEHMIAKLSGFFGALALTLAAIGLYGVMSYTTARRTMEIGIRFALGAERSSVMGMVFRDTFRLVLIGLIIGVFVSTLTAKLFAKALFGLSAFDPLTSILGACVITLAAQWQRIYRPGVRREWTPWWPAVRIIRYEYP